MVFVDGNHAYEYVLGDALNSWPLLAPNGFIVFHDYECVEETTRAVKDFCKQTGAIYASSASSESVKLLTVPYLIAKLRESQPVDLTPGEQIRDWLYVDDVVNALLAAATCEHLGPSGIFNVCSGHGIRVRELAEQVADTMNKPRDLLRFGARPYRSDEPMWIVGDNRRFVEATAWQPRVSMAEGIRRMVVRPA